MCQPVIFAVAVQCLPYGTWTRAFSMFVINVISYALRHSKLYMIFVFCFVSFVRKPEYYFHFVSFLYTELALVWNRLKLFVEIIINIITISLLFHHHNPNYDLQKSISKPYHSSYTKVFSAYLMWYTTWHSQSARYVSIYILIFRHIFTS